MKQPEMITGNVNAKTAQQAILNIFNLAVQNTDRADIQTFDAFTMGVVMAYISERKEDFDSFVKEKDL